MDKHDWQLVLAQTIVVIIALVLIVSCKTDDAAALAPPPVGETTTAKTAASEPTPPPDSFPLTVINDTSGRIDGIIGVKVTPVERRNHGNSGDSTTVLTVLAFDPTETNRSHVIMHFKVAPLAVRYFADVPTNQPGWISFVIDDGIKYCFDGACIINRAEVHLHSLDELH